MSNEQKRAYDNEKSVEQDKQKVTNCRRKKRKFYTHNFIAQISQNISAKTNAKLKNNIIQKNKLNYAIK